MRVKKRTRIPKKHHHIVVMEGDGESQKSEKEQLKREEGSVGRDKSVSVRDPVR